MIKILRMNFPSIFLFFLKVPLLIRVELMYCNYIPIVFSCVNNWSPLYFFFWRYLYCNYAPIVFSFVNILCPLFFFLDIPVPIWVGLLYRNYAPIVLFCVKILIPLFIYFSGDMVTDTSWICTVIVFKYYFLVSIF